MWSNDFKIALAQKNTQKIDELIAAIPTFETKQEIQQAMYLIKDAYDLIYTLKDETSQSMRQIKKTMNFIGSAQAPSINKLDIKS